MIEPSALVLLVVLAGLAAVPVLLRRHRATAPDAVRVLARTALHKHAVVAVLAVGERRLLVGASERGVQLLADLDIAAATTTTTTPTGCTKDPLGRTDAVGTPFPTTSIEAAPDALAGLEALSGASIAGPGTGLVDRLREMTVRTPLPGRPIRVPLRR